MKRMLIFLMGCLIINSSLGVGCGEEERVIPPRPQQLGNEFPKRKRYIPLHRLAKVPRTADATPDILVPSEADLAEAGPSTSAAGPEDALDFSALGFGLPTKNQEIWKEIGLSIIEDEGKYFRISEGNFNLYDTPVIPGGRPATKRGRFIAALGRYALKHGLASRKKFLDFFGIKNVARLNWLTDPSGKLRINPSSLGIERTFHLLILKK